MNKTIEELISEAQAESEAAMDTPDPDDVTITRPNRAGSVVQSVRLPGDAFTEIEGIAKASGVPVGALIRGWVLEALAGERTTTLVSALDQLASDVERVKRLAAKPAA